MALRRGLAGTLPFAVLCVCGPGLRSAPDDSLASGREFTARFCLDCRRLTQPVRDRVPRPQARGLHRVRGPGQCGPVSQRAHQASRMKPGAATQEHSIQPLLCATDRCTVFRRRSRDAPATVRRFNSRITAGV